MTALARRSWVPAACEDLVQSIAAEVAGRDAAATSAASSAQIASMRSIASSPISYLSPG